MDPLSQLAKSLALLPRQPGARPAPAAARQPAQVRSSPQRAHTPGALRQRIAAGLQALNRAEAGSAERRIEVFVEQVLLHEWGPDFRESAGFRQTVRRVVRTMKTEPRLRAQLEATLRELAPEGHRPD